MKRNPYIIVISMLILLSIFGSGCTLPVCTTPEILVTRPDDVRGGLCEPDDCSLRQAIQASNACIGTQTVVIPEGTYFLTRMGSDEDRSSLGDLDIIDSVHILGNNMPVIDGNASDRVFDIQPGAAVDITGLVIQNGRHIPGGAFGEGGGVQNKGNLTATGVLIRDNVGRDHGNGGGGFFNSSEATAVISHSAIISNYSEEGAGGILNYGEMTLDNVTISGNDAYGIFNGGPLEVFYSTIADNEVVQIWIGASVAPVVMSNSIIAGFPDAGGCFGGSVVPNGFNIEYVEAGTERVCDLTGSNDMPNVDPMLLPLSAYDGATPPFHALDPASPAIDSADPANCSGIDQRGVARPQGLGCDRGAYEWAQEISIPDLPVATAPPEFEPPELIPFILVVQVPANCRQGPGVAYPVVNSALPGEQVQVIGKNADGTWWYSQLKNDKCFISNIAGTPQGDLSLLAIIPAPPTPVPTKTPVVEAEQPEATEEVIVEPDNDGDGYSFSKDCNDKDPKINPGAFETPNDKVDSNCNGDDDK